MRKIEGLYLLKRLITKMPSPAKVEAGNQPVPRVTPADVERIIHREFPYDGITAMEILNEYGTEKWHRETDRVRLAALKLSGGTLDGLRRAVIAAKQDYRDVLGPAEFPDAMKAWSNLTKLAAKDKERIYAEDWRQYESWLKR